MVGCCLSSGAAVDDMPSQPKLLVKPNSPEKSETCATTLGGFLASILS